MATTDAPLYGEKTLLEWDRLWVRVPNGLKAKQRHLRSKLGLIRCTLNGRVMYIGTAADRRAGIAKRLYDFIRKSPSGRNHYAGRKIYENRENLEVDVIYTGTSFDGQNLAEALKTPMIRLHRPEWNVANAPFQRKA
ncbi:MULTISPECIES: hypothetical protein [unclassified Brevundimonas]|uniref:hypothetical protein n=1 Tax=unclassified Brevundimonas TaxID=2622653 RepID=UPI0025B8279B|nr:MULTISPECIES: hypothetical protein [unclassified Brevundimonas]